MQFLNSIVQASLFSFEYSRSVITERLGEWPGIQKPEFEKLIFWYLSPKGWHSIHMPSSLELSAALLNRDKSTSLDPTSFIFNMQMTPARYTVTGGITVVQLVPTGEMHESEETRLRRRISQSKISIVYEFQGYFGGRNM
jgi:hypothetical protein